MFVASVRHKPPIGNIPACAALWRNAGRTMGAKEAETLEQDDKRYRACFGAHAANEPFFAGLTNEAQRLVDRLAGR